MQACAQARLAHTPVTGVPPHIPEPRVQMAEQAQSVLQARTARARRRRAILDLVPSVYVLLFGGLVAVQSAPSPTGPIALVTLNPFRTSASMNNDTEGWPGTIEEGRRVYELNWRCYAQLHGYVLYIERDDQAARHLFPPSEQGLTGAALELWSTRTSRPERLRLPAPYSPFWVKTVLVERHLPAHPWVLYFDSDVIFLALPSRLEDVLGRVTTAATDLVVITNTQSIGLAVKSRLCACIFAVRSSPGGWWFVRRWFQLRKQDSTFGDMGAFSHTVVEMHLRHAAALRARANAGPGRSAAAPWHAPQYDTVTSRCLHPHWALTERMGDYQCMERAMRSLMAGLPPSERPRVDTPTSWPVAFSTELAANVQQRQMGLIGFGGGLFVPRKSNYPQRLERVQKLILRWESPGYAPSHTLPALMAHHKTGKHFILLSLYHKTAIARIARACSRRIRCIHPITFVNRSLLDPAAPSWELPKVDPSKC